MTFNPEMEFLLAWNFENMFSKASFRPEEFEYVCKGCNEVMPQWKRKEHFEAHKTERKMIREASALAARLNQERGGNGDTRIDVCIQCGQEFQQERKRGRPRKKCYDCLP
jgi:hypothetical protein